MHPSSLQMMESLLQKHAAPFIEKRLLDVGAQDVNGTYRELVTRLGFHSYTGVDMQRGKNVDFVVPEEGDWSSAVTDRYPVVISGQCLEHTRWPWIWIGQLTELTADNGLVIVIAPWQWKIHRYPVDCWRILPDGMQALFDWAGLKTVEVGVNEKDCYGVARKEPIMNET